MIAGRFLLFLASFSPFARLVGHLWDGMDKAVAVISGSVSNRFDLWPFTPDAGNN